MNTTSKTTANKVDPSKLLPDFDNLPGEVTAKHETFWLGLTADCPLGQIDVAGLHFPAYQESIDRNNAGQQVRTPQVGALNKVVTRQHFDALVAVLPRLVIRFKKSRADEPGTGQNVGDPADRREGYLVKIPDERMIAGATAHGRALKPYVRQEGDRPAAEFMFFHHAPNGKRGLEYRPIAEAGLEWPESGAPEAEVANAPRKAAATTSAS